MYACLAIHLSCTYVRWRVIELVCSQLFPTRPPSPPALPATAASGTWAIPAFLSAMTQLTYLDLSSSHLTGSLPASWSTMVSLTIMSVATGSISGTLPPQWSALASNLSYVWLGFNSMTGWLGTWVQGYHVGLPGGRCIGAYLVGLLITK